MSLSAQTKNKFTVGSYLARRLEEIGACDYFTVPGDFNLTLLDEFLKNPKLRLVSCCNELNAGYAADGYARAKGVGVTVTTFCVGSLSQINAIAGAYAEDLPVIAISGGPNTHAQASGELLHHTLGNVSNRYVCDLFAQVTACATIVTDPAKAPRQIDDAIQLCLRLKKPIYLEIACNIADAPCREPKPFLLEQKNFTKKLVLAKAVKHAARKLGEAKKPMLVAGVKLRSSDAQAAFTELVRSSGYAFASMPNAKGFIAETLKEYTGIYWGAISSVGVKEVVESAEAVVYAGPVFTDYTTCGHTMLLNDKRIIRVDPESVTIDGVTYPDIRMKDFLFALSQVVTFNSTSLHQFNQTKMRMVTEKKIQPHKKLTRQYLFTVIQSLLQKDSLVIAETGDSWFNCMQLALPEGCGFEIQMQYGSIGWSVGATLGAALGRQDKRRVVACIGDGSFQLTAQELSTMIRYETNPIIFLINNRGYTIEVEIHDGPYNQIQNWKYTELVSVFNGKNGKGFGCRVANEGELLEAVNQSRKNKGPSFIEVLLEPDDCSKELLEFGSYVAQHNGREKP